MQAASVSKTESRGQANPFSRQLHCTPPPIPLGIAGNVQLGAVTALYNHPSARLKCTTGYSHHTLMKA